MDVVSASFDIITATDASELAACCDFATIPALEIVRVVKLGGNRDCYYKQNLTAKYP